MSVLLPDAPERRLLLPPTRCWRCGDPLDQARPYAAHTNAAGELVGFHQVCAADYSLDLAGDVRELSLADGLGGWRNRAVQLTRRRLVIEEARP